jgi:glycosyltransferase involved in cell wall biosynthesis
MRIICYGSFIDYQVQLANELSKRAEVMLAIPNEQNLNDQLCSIDKDVILNLLTIKKPIFYPSNFVVFKKFVKKINIFKPDIIHIQLIGNSVDFFIFLLCKFLNKYPLVTTFHDVNLHIGEELLWLNFYRKWIRMYSNLIMVHGEKLKEQMIEQYNLPYEKVHAIHIGEHQVAPFKKYENQDIKEDGNLILFFGRIHEYKGLEYLIKAEPMITKKVPNAKIIIAGAGEDFVKYEEMMGNRKERFIVHNYLIPYEEGAELFQKSSVVVLPYIDASQSGVIPTAYCFKKPVVVTNVGSIPEVVDEGKTGFIVTSKDSQALAEAVIRILKDKKLRMEMGKNAYSKLKNDFSWDRIAERTIMIYKKAIGGFS